MLLGGDREISTSMQRFFGISLAVVIAVVCYPIGTTGFQIGVAVALATLAIYYLLPVTQRPIIQLWRFVTFPIAFVVGHALLAGIYFLILTPIGLTLRLLGRDELDIRARGRFEGTNTEGESFWEARPRERDPEDYFRQY
jgi:ABC-type uncharacterized transport system permease subunit